MQPDFGFAFGESLKPRANFSARQAAFEIAAEDNVGDSRVSSGASVVEGADGREPDASVNYFGVDTRAGLDVTVLPVQPVSDFPCLGQRARIAIAHQTTEHIGIGHRILLSAIHRELERCMMAIINKRNTIRSLRLASVEVSVRAVQVHPVDVEICYVANTGVEWKRGRFVLEIVESCGRAAGRAFA